jgi:hypothetical protein
VQGHQAGRVRAVSDDAIKIICSTVVTIVVILALFTEVFDKRKK